MVIILNHTIAAAYLYYRDRGRFVITEDKTEQRHRANMGIPDGVQEAILRLSGVVTYEQLEDAVKEALESALPNVSDVVVYLQTTDGQEMVSSHGLLHTLPKEGLAWEAVQQRQRLIVQNLDEADPLSGLLKTGTTHSPLSRKGLLCCGPGWTYARKDSVVCSPVKDQETDKVVAVFVVVCGEMSKDDHQHLSFLERQLLVCFKRLKQAAQLNSSTPITNSTTTRSSKIAAKNASILNLCAELYDHDAATLQQKVLKYLETNTKAQGGLLLLVDPEHNELCCQVIGGKVLEDEMRFSINLPDTETGPQIQGDNFARVILTKHPITLDDIDKKQREELEEMVGWKLASMLAVPVISRATSEVVAIACMLNKQGADRFSEEDTKVIRHCFDYTAAVLHSTLAVQNERRLKQKTQTLLQVAKNLFTRLGEYVGDLFEDSSYDKAINYALCKTRDGQQPHRPVTRSITRGLRTNKEKHQPSSPALKKDSQFKQSPGKKLKLSLPSTPPGKGKKGFGDKHKGHQGSPQQASLEVDAVIEKQERLAEKMTGRVEREGASCSQKTRTKTVPVLKESQDGHSPSPRSYHTRSQSPYDVHSGKTGGRLAGTSPQRAVSTDQRKDSGKNQDLSHDSLSIRLSAVKSPKKETSSHETNRDASPSSSQKPTLKPNRLKTSSRSPERKASWETTDIESPPKRLKHQSPLEKSPSPKRFSRKLCLPALDPNSLSSNQSGLSKISPASPGSSDDEPVSSRTRHRSGADSPDRNLPGVSCGSEPTTDSQLDLALNSAFLVGGSGSDIALPSPSTSKEVKKGHNSGTNNVGMLVTVSDVDRNQSHSLVYSSSSSDLVNDDSSSGYSLKPVDSDIAWERRTMTCSGQVPTQPPSSVGLAAPNDLTMLLREIMQEARNLTKAERCSVFLLDEQANELVAKVFDGDIRNGKEVQQSSDDEPMSTEVRIPADQGIAGHVATTGEILNIDDAYSHPLFYRGVDESTGFRTRNILCFPIKDDKETVIGVAQLCNKINGMGFSQFDMEIAQAFSIYCCISIVHTLMYQKVRDSQIRSRLASELMMYHMKVEPVMTSALAKKEIPMPGTFHEDFSKFCFTPRIITYDESTLAVISMFEEMGFIERFRLPRENLANFILMVRRGYRDPPYHNWAHAFAVGHFCYIMYRNLHLSNFLTELELFCLFVACLCHDIDHRGTTNSFQVASESVLAALYSSEGSVMERHHFAQTMCILNMDECNIFVNVSQAEYEKCLDLIRDIILATDLAHHLKILPDLETMAKGGYNKKDKKQKMNLLCLLMTSCDLSDQTKNWKNTKKIAELIYQEFFSQGDKEKTFGRTPMEMMDRERAYIPELQIGFLDGIAAPVFNLLAELFPGASEVKEAVKRNRAMWVRMHQKIQRERLAPTNSMEVFEMDIVGETDS